MPRETSPTPPDPIKPRWTTRDSWACLVAAALGCLLAVEPHLAALARYGSIEYLTDNDDILALGMTRAAYHHGAWAVEDPYAGHWRDVPALHAWLQFVPTTMLARSLGVPFLLQTLIWRVGGGLALGASLFFLFRRILAGTSRPTAWALGCALICLGDAGFMDGRVLAGDLWLVRWLAQGVTPMDKAGALPQYRVVAPLTNLPFLLLLLASLVPTGAVGWSTIRGRRGDVALGAASLAACVLLYFFYWTTAVVALGMYLAGLLVWAGWSSAGRSLALGQARVTALVLAVGLALGSPQIVDNSRTFGDPAMKPLVEKAGRGFRLPEGDPRRYGYVKNVWVWGKLAVGVAALAAFRNRGPGLVHGLAVLGCTGFAGYALANSAIVTGLEFENFHWSMLHASATAILVLAAASAGLDGLARSWPISDRNARRLRIAAWGIPAGLIAFAAVWRPFDALNAPHTVELNTELALVRPIRPVLEALDGDATLAGASPTRVAFLYTPCGLLYCDAYTYQMFITVDEANRRHALNAWLLGASAAEYDRAARPVVEVVPFPGPETEAERVRRERTAVFRTLLDDPEEAGRQLETFRVRYLLTPDGPAPSRGGPWSRLAAVPGWTLWERAAGRNGRRIGIRSSAPLLFGAGPAISLDRP